MHTNRLRNLFYLQLCVILLFAAVACNSKTDDDTEIAITSSIVAVKNFTLSKNDSVLAHLDSVFFSIDLDHGVIFNADSLPVGTNVSRLVASITFANTMSKAELSFRKDNRVDTTVNYLTNPTDSIDFTYPVTLNVAAQDGTSEYQYTIKVNIHKTFSDTLVWDLIESSPLPSRFKNPRQQKTLSYTNQTYCFIQENDGSFTLAVSPDLNKAEWQKTELSLDFIPNIEEFSASDEFMYILAENGELYKSQNGFNWTSTGIFWASIIGGYGNSVLGLREENGVYYHTIFPMPESFVEQAIDSDFPIKGSSQLGLINTEWSDSLIAILAGGYNSANQQTSNVWGYDGNNWSILYSKLPALSYPMMARYVVFKETPAAFAQREFDAWLLFGGILEDGAFNKEMFISIDNGVTWTSAPQNLQLPAQFPSTFGSDVIVAKFPLSADLSDVWTKTDPYTRSDYIINGTEITWDCPYLFVFGGYDTDNSELLNTNIWRGVINRLQFTPAI